MKALISGLLLISGCLLFCCGRKTSKPPESLAGQIVGYVTVAPLQPVARRDEPPPPPNQKLLQSMKVLIYSEQGDKLVESVSLDEEGRFHATVKPGAYMVKMKLAKMQRAQNLPKVVQVAAGDTTKLEIDIDTGIR